MTTYHSPLSLFMTNKTLSGVKKHNEIHQSPKSKMGLLLYLLLSSDRLAQNCDSVMAVFMQNSSILHWAVQNHITSRNLTRHLKPLTQEIWFDFLHLYMRAHKALSNTTYSGLQVCCPESAVKLWCTCVLRMCSHCNLHVHVWVIVSVSCCLDMQQRLPASECNMSLVESCV